MKVAIIGAGIAGLACAIELEKQGIKPYIFEQKHRVGSPFPFAPMLFNSTFYPSIDQIKELKRCYDIRIKPISKLNFLRVQGPNTQYTVTGKLGYTVLRGQEQSSIECQMAGMLKTPIIFEKPVKAQDLLKHFDYLVVADGTKAYADNLSIWHSSFKSCIRGATILGRFNPEEVRCWFNTTYSKGGFAYMVPLGIETASLVLIVPNITMKQLPQYWQTFLKYEKINPEFVSQWDMEYETGLVYPHRVGNTFFVGNSGGFVTSWLGEGVFSCIASGVEAARSIALGRDYKKNMKYLYDVMERHAKIRYLWDRLDNNKLDRAVKLLGTPPGKLLFYNSYFDILKVSDPLINFLIHSTKEKEKTTH